MSNPILHMLGLAKKAGRLEVGEEPVGAAARGRQAKLILVASDAASNTLRRAAHFAESNEILWLQLPFTKDELGDQIGRGMVAIIAVTDAGFAASITEKMVASDPERYGPIAQKLREKADRVYARQKEKRQHEKNVQRGKYKPWAVPPKKQADGAKPTAKKSRSGGVATVGRKSSQGSQSDVVATSHNSANNKSNSIPKTRGTKLRVARAGSSTLKNLRNEVAAHDE